MIAEVHITSNALRNKLPERFFNGFNDEELDGTLLDSNPYVALNITERDGKLRNIHAIAVADDVLNIDNAEEFCEHYLEEYSYFLTDEMKGEVQAKFAAR